MSSGMTGARTAAPEGATGSREWARFTRLCAIVASLGCAALTTTQTRADTAPGATEGPSCQTVRLSDVGWTDVTATTATLSVLLREIGYQPQVTVLSVPVTYTSMKNKDID